jgi:hypothetical protein
MQTDYPDFLIDAVPGARKLADEVDKLTADAAPLSAAVRAAINARRGKVRGMRHGPSEGDVRLVPVDGVTAAEFDKLNAAKADAEAAVNSHARKVRAARKDFDDRMRAVSRERRREVAEPVHRAAHDEAVEALTKLEAALRARHAAAPYAAEDGKTVMHVSFSLLRVDDSGAYAKPEHALRSIGALLDATAPSA